MTITVTTAHAKETFSELINSVAHHQERILLTRRGKEIAAIVTMDDWYTLENFRTQDDFQQATESLRETKQKGARIFDSKNTPYHVKISPAAERHTLALSSQHQHIVVKSIEALAVNPRPPGVKKIEGMTGLYCQEVEQQRLIYKVEDQEILLLLVR